MIGLRNDVLRKVVPYETLGEMLEDLEMYVGLDEINEAADEDFTIEECN